MQYLAIFYFPYSVPSHLYFELIFTPRKKNHLQEQDSEFCGCFFLKYWAPPNLRICSFLSPLLSAMHLTLPQDDFTLDSSLGLTA